MFDDFDTIVNVEEMMNYEELLNIDMLSNSLKNIAIEKYGFEHPLTIEVFKDCSIVATIKDMETIERKYGYMRL